MFLKCPTLDLRMALGTSFHFLGLDDFTKIGLWVISLSLSGPTQKYVPQILDFWDLPVPSYWPLKFDLKNAISKYILHYPISKHAFMCMKPIIDCLAGCQVSYGGINSVPTPWAEVWAKIPHLVDVTFALVKRGGVKGIVGCSENQFQVCWLLGNRRGVVENVVFMNYKAIWEQSGELGNWLRLWEM